MRIIKKKVKCYVYCGFYCLATMNKHCEKQTYKEQLRDVSCLRKKGV